MMKNYKYDVQGARGRARSEEVGEQLELPFNFDTKAGG